MVAVRWSLVRTLYKSCLKKPRLLSNTLLYRQLFQRESNPDFEALPVGDSRPCRFVPLAREHPEVRRRRVGEQALPRGQGPVAQKRRRWSPTVWCRSWPLLQEFGGVAVGCVPTPDWCTDFRTLRNFRQIQPRFSLILLKDWNCPFWLLFFSNQKINLPLQMVEFVREKEGTFEKTGWYVFDLVDARQLTSNFSAL